MRSCPSFIFQFIRLQFLLQSHIFTNALQISVPSTVNLGTISSATLTWESGDPSTVVLTLLNKSNGTSSIVAKTSTETGFVPLSFNTTGGYVVQAFSSTDSGTILAQSGVIQVSDHFINGNLESTDAENATTKTGSPTTTTGSVQDSSALSTTDSVSETIPSVSTVTVQSTVIFIPSIARSSSQSTSTAIHTSASVRLTTDLASSPALETHQVSSLANPTNVSTPSTGTLTNRISVPVVVSVVLAIAISLLIILLLVKWYFWHSPSRGESKQRRKQKRNAKRISPFPFNYDALRPSTWGRQGRGDDIDVDVEDGFDNDAFVGRPRSRDRSAILDEEEQGQEYDTKSTALGRSASVLSLVSGKTCTTYTADHIDSAEYENRISLPTLRGVSVSSNFGSTDSESPKKLAGPRRSTEPLAHMSVRTSNAQPLLNEVRESFEPEISWLQEEMRRFIDDREAGWAFEGFQEAIAEERPPAYSS